MISPVVGLNSLRMVAAKMNPELNKRLKTALSIREDDAKTVRAPAVEPVAHEVRSSGMHALPTELKEEMAKKRAEVGPRS